MIRAAALAVVLALGSPAFAQTPAAPAPDPALLAKAHTLMTVMRAEEQTRKLLDTQLAQVMKSASSQALSAIPPQPGITDDPEFKAILDRYMTRLSTDMRASMTTLLPQMIAQMEAIYARNFTARELDDITAFYQGPSGQAFVGKMPQVMGEYMTAMQATMMPVLMKSVQSASADYMSEIKAWAAKHPELKGRSQ